MHLTKKNLYISVILIVIVTIGIVLFLKPMQVNNAIEKMVEDMNKQYDEDFEVMWSDIEQQPSFDTYRATVKSKESGYVYDVSIKNNRAKLDYEQVNAQMELNEQIEASIPDTLAITDEEQVVLISANPLSSKQLHAITPIVDSDSVDVIELNKENYEIAVDYVTQYYQRSTMPLKDLDQYNPKRYTIALK